jgi:hypothetical protein
VRGAVSDDRPYRDWGAIYESIDLMIRVAAKFG